MIGFRQADARFPFLWESPAQPAGRWHADGEGPAHYIADTPHGAWAELLRHEEITDPADVLTIRRALWAIDVGDAPFVEVQVPPDVATGDPGSYPRCQEHARRARGQGATRLRAPSAALLPGGAAGVRVEHGESPAPARDGRVLVVYGAPAALVGWQVVDAGAPPAGLLARVRHFGRLWRRPSGRP
jgi:RES domain